MNSILTVGGIVLFIWGAVKKSRGMMIGGYIASVVGVAGNAVDVGIEAGRAGRTSVAFADLKTLAPGV